MTRGILELFEERAPQNFSLHERFPNTQMVRVLGTIGFDRRYVRASGPYLHDDRGDQYLDPLSGYGVFADTENVGGAIWDLRKNLASAALRTKVGR
jgi:ornithine--oxo-acid transaminase